MALTKEQFLKGMALIGSAFPDKVVDESTLEVYLAVLSPKFTPQAWERTVIRMIEKCKFYPTISEIIKEGTALAPQAPEVWNRLLAAAEQGLEPEVDEPTRRALEAIGGWEEFQYTSYKELKFLRKLFTEVYEAHIESGKIALPSPEKKRLAR